MTPLPQAVAFSQQARLSQGVKILSLNTVGREVCHINCILYSLKGSKS